MNDNQSDARTAIEMHEHGVPEYRNVAPSEPFPIIRREKRRYASDIGAPSIQTVTVYTLGDDVPGVGSIRVDQLCRLDPRVDEPMVLMIMTHPLGTDVEAVSNAMRSMAYWRGCGSDHPMQWRIGEDRVWTLHRFNPIPGTASHVIVRKGLRMTAVEGLDGPMNNWDYDMQIRDVRGQNNENVHWHRHYAGDAPVPGTALYSPARSTESQLGEWFSKRLSVPMSDGTDQTVLDIEVTLEGPGGIVHSAIRCGERVMAHRCKFSFMPGDVLGDTLTWTASYENSGWDETVFPEHLAAMLTAPASPLAIGWRRRAGIL